MTTEEVAQLNSLQGFEQLLYASGGAHVEEPSDWKPFLGKWGTVIQEEVALSILDDGYQIAGESYGQVILATGAWVEAKSLSLGCKWMSDYKRTVEDYQLDLGVQWSICSHA